MIYRPRSRAGTSNGPNASQATPARRCRFAFSLALIASGAALSGCADVDRAPFTQAMQQDAQIPGIADARFWADAPDAAQRMAPSGGTAGTDLTMLALSGGGVDGAFGAGVLTGWTKAGTRPNFSIVTGVSTGALIAPFAFLGSRYDAALADVYTHVSAHEIYRARFPLAFLWTSSLYDTAPLARTIEAHVTDAMIDEIAQEQDRGRRLFVGTANLDAQRMVIWNMGAIAASHEPGRYALFRKVLLASSAIPALFPPVMINAVAQGQPISEMHVDGGDTASILTVPPQAVIEDQAPPNPGQVHLYLVVNNKLGGDFHMVKPRTIPILSQAFTLEVQSSLYSLVSTSYLFAHDHGIEFNLNYIHNEYRTAFEKYLDADEMRRLYDYGVGRGQGAQSWDKHPPGQSELVATPGSAVTVP